MDMAISEPPAKMMRRLEKVMGEYPEWRTLVIRRDALALDLFKQIFGGN